MLTKRNVPIALPSVGEEEWNATKEVFMSGWLTQGPQVKKFEEEFASRIGSRHALATTSCTTGLHLGLLALGVKPGDEVIVPAFTWVATANAVLYCGARPVFCDVSTKTFNIDNKQLKKLRTPKTKAIIPVHLFGLCSDTDEIREELPGVAILEDAACAAGAKLDSQRYAGALGDVAAFSFHPRKAITTGEGGMLTTENKELFELMDQYRNHGASLSEEKRHLGPKPYLLADFNLLGYNYRMTDIQAAVGRVQLKKLSDFIGERTKWAQYYNDKFKDIPWLETPDLPEKGEHALQAYVCRVNPELAPAERNLIMERLQSMGVSTRPGTHAVHMLQYYRDLYKMKPDDFPGAKFCDQQTMALPLHNKMTPEDYEYVVQCVQQVAK